MNIKYKKDDEKKLFKNVNDLIETLECDELSFLEVIEPKYEKEIETIISKKHCLGEDVANQNKDLI